MLSETCHNLIQYSKVICKYLGRFLSLVFGFLTTSDKWSSLSSESLSSPPARNSSVERSWSFLMTINTRIQLKLGPNTHSKYIVTRFNLNRTLVVALGRLTLTIKSPGRKWRMLQPYPNSMSIDFLFIWHIVTLIHSFLSLSSFSLHGFGFYYPKARMHTTWWSSNLLMYCENMNAAFFYVEWMLINIYFEIHLITIQLQWSLCANEMLRTNETNLYLNISHIYE